MIQDFQIGRIPEKSFLADAFYQIIHGEGGSILYLGHKMVDS